VRRHADGRAGEAELYEAYVAAAGNGGLDFSAIIRTLK
jgi:hypothetical protein